VALLLAGDDVTTSPSQGGTRNLDECPVCHKRVLDFEDGGFEGNDGQRGHYGCGVHPLTEDEVADLILATRSGE
jgi:hypothetical protein